MLQQPGGVRVLRCLQPAVWVHMLRHDCSEPLHLPTLRCCSAEERAVLAGYQGSPSALSSSEQFMLEVRLRCWAQAKLQAKPNALRFCEWSLCCLLAQQG